MSVLTVERLREVLDYEPETGVFRWKVRTSRRVSVGDVAGCTSGENYRRNSIDGRLYRAHRLAWFHVHGKWPDQTIDHRNGRGQDTSLANLRVATYLENSQNLGGPKRNNSHGFFGAFQDKRTGRWQAQIRVGGQVRCLGCFDSGEAAQAAYLSAKAELHPFWARAS